MTYADLFHEYSTTQTMLFYDIEFPKNSFKKQPFVLTDIFFLFDTFLSFSLKKITKCFYFKRKMLPLHPVLKKSSKHNN